MISAVRLRWKAAADGPASSTSAPDIGHVRLVETGTRFRRTRLRPQTEEGVHQGNQLASSTRLGQAHQHC
eukprot:8495714-Pyramimonas_sp.AAC.1